MENRELSSYAFNTYGGDASLYNGIHDLETEADLLKRKAAAFDEIKRILFAYTDNEITAHPWWAIVRNGSFGRMVVLDGPFFSRERAEQCRKAREYEYGSKSYVYCYSGGRSQHYIALREAVLAVDKDGEPK